MDRVSLGATIARGLRDSLESVRDQFQDPGGVRAAVLDGVLDPQACDAIYSAFPDPSAMMRRSTLREHKYVTSQMDRYAPLLEEVVFAFQQPPVVELLGSISANADLTPDHHLYAGGLSVMGKGDFLNPHVDNSHDKDRRLYRVLNLLYYVTPGWRPAYGGSLQLWDRGPRRPGARTIPSLGNRLVIMGTDRRSWHSVSPVLHPGARCCVSNYYFAPRPLHDAASPPLPDYFHPTVFRGFTDERVKDAVLRADAALRTTIRRVRREGLVAPRHLYRRD